MILRILLISRGVIGYFRIRGGRRRDSSRWLELEQWPSNLVRSTRFVNPERSWQASGKMVQLYPPPPSALSSFLLLHLLPPPLRLYFFLLSNNKRALAFTPALLPDRKEIPYGHLGLVTAAKTRGNPAAFVDPEVRYDSNRKDDCG